MSVFDAAAFDRKAWPARFRAAMFEIDAVRLGMLCEVLAEHGFELRADS